MQTMTTTAKAPLPTPVHSSRIDCLRQVATTIASLRPVSVLLVHSQGAANSIYFGEDVQGTLWQMSTSV